MMFLVFISGLITGIALSGLIVVIEIYLSHRTKLILPRISEELEQKGFVELPDKREETFNRAFKYEEDV